MEKNDILVINARNQNLSVGQRHLAFGELVNRFYDAAYRWAYAVLEDRHQAQDAVQEAFVVAFQSLDQLRDPLAFSGWLRQIVVSQAYRQVREQSVDSSSIESAPDLPAYEPGPAAILEEIEMKERVMTAVQALPEKEQIVTQLFYLNGYSQHEIARLLELPLTTVKKRLQYARQNLKGIMASMVDSFTPPVAPPEPVLAPIPVRHIRQPKPESY
ncbi:MAG TPA: sigma-70 family RNA polymerase sigma factor [Chloroflexota bacterium]|nr:sigma-70 family RNA polymerase sigma factor [Chloroflexota bacterium]HUM69866.1 sigma-70 family RNA polymerase sigma factor [Chloroflexota bacterium]